MVKFLLKLFFGNYERRIDRLVVAFTKIIEKCKKLDEEMQEDIRKKKQKIYSINLEINDIEKSVTRNGEFMNNVQKIKE